MQKIENGYDFNFFKIIKIDVNNCHLFNSLFEIISNDNYYNLFRSICISFFCFYQSQYVSIIIHLSQSVSILITVFVTICFCLSLYVDSIYTMYLLQSVCVIYIILIFACLDIDSTKLMVYSLYHFVI